MLGGRGTGVNTEKHKEIFWDDGNVFGGGDGYVGVCIYQTSWHATVKIGSFYCTYNYTQIKLILKVAI